MLEVIKIEKNFKKLKVLKNISFNVEPGEIVGILGENGAGKTTILKIITGLIIQDEGYINIMNQPLNKKSKKNLGLLLEGDRNLFLNYTVKENIIYFGSLNGIIGKKLKENTEELLKKLNLKNIENKIVSDLSRGMKQKLSLATTLIGDPNIILMDEPFLGLDLESKDIMIKTIKNLLKEKKSIIITSHDMDIMEKLCQRVIILHKGEILIDETVNTLKQDLLNSKSYTIEYKFNNYNLIKNEIQKNKNIIIENFDKNNFSFSGYKDKNLFYDVINILKDLNVEIISSKQKLPDLKEIYLNITKGYEL
ncbi:ABC-2 type transport system ATP-binding protein [Oceanotoga teriensis]|uniref:ABC-2 type transport system ATP-binding protein n=1 Tax=Oceanotoga teriensis TaxID=515440 RepID=A0AA45C6Z1_9BACT|nr:ABC transporter ATP-binding protein [Oceanotoga teriensis]PWJ93279.1 ABC-2 type transport system ATP-binding protein [Oceanotoga teriensis]